MLSPAWSAATASKQPGPTMQLKGVVRRPSPPGAALSSMNQMTGSLAPAGVLVPLPTLKVAVAVSVPLALVIV